MTGTELIVIAAVVLGGASITGGRGSVLGAILGVLVIVIINNSLLLLGIPSFWQRFVTGVLIIIGTGITSIRSTRSQRKSITSLPDLTEKT
jgi:simple sugar transport system permease protein